MPRMAFTKHSPYLLCLAVCLVVSPAAAQVDDNLPIPIPPPLPPRELPDDLPKYKSIIEDAPDEEWKLPQPLLESLRRTAVVYEAYSRRFVCDEEARVAEYKDGEVKKEDSNRYGYLLTRGSVGEPVRESRQNITSDGKYKGNVEDNEPFPPAYAWVFLFSEFYEPYFDFRVVDERFEGFDPIIEIHFRGSLPFTDGKDIRQWEGKILVDAIYFTPLQLDAEPMGQAERMDVLFRQWAQSFNLLGFKTGQKPLGYTAALSFGLKKGDLRLPTSLRYDTRRVVAPNETVMVRASSRIYTNYKITTIGTGEPRIGPIVGEDGGSQPAP